MKLNTQNILKTISRANKISSLRVGTEFKVVNDNNCNTIFRIVKINKTSFTIEDTTWVSTYRVKKEALLKDKIVIIKN